MSPESNENKGFENVSFDESVKSFLKTRGYESHTIDDSIIFYVGNITRFELSKMNIGGIDNFYFKDIDELDFSLSKNLSQKLRETCTDNMEVIKGALEEIEKEVFIELFTRKNGSKPTSTAINGTDDYGILLKDTYYLQQTHKDGTRVVSYKDYIRKNSPKMNGG